MPPRGGSAWALLVDHLSRPATEVDKELEKRGHAFVRYADDCNVYVRSERAGERVMETLRRLYAQLRLRVNEAKSAVARPQNRKFLGYSFWVATGRKIRRRIAPKALVAMKERVRGITARNGGRSMDQVIDELRSYLTGWKAYFRLAETPRVLSDLDEWIRHRLRLVQLKQWKRGKTVYRVLRTRGLPEHEAALAARFARNWWRLSGSHALNIALAREATSTAKESRGLRPNLNNSNRRMRTRTSGGVGGERRG
jgi:RNA-directed DNA polymerase